MPNLKKLPIGLESLLSGRVKWNEKIKSKYSHYTRSPVNIIIIPTFESVDIGADGSHLFPDNF